MQNEKVVAFFEESGSPVTGLQPTIVARDLEDETLFSDVMTEVGGGWYSYRIENYNKGRVYLITIDGGVTLDDSNRFQYASNELDSYPNKLDRRSISTWNIDYKYLAKEVWDSKVGEAKEGSYGSLLAGGIDYEMINKQFEDMSEKIKKIKLPEIKFPDMPKSLSIDDVERLLKKYDKNEELSTVVSLVKSIREMIDFLVEEYATIKQNGENIETKVGSVLENMEEVEEKIDNIDPQETIDKLRQIHSQIGDFDILMKNLSSLPDMVDTYKEILKGINTNKSIDDKLVTIRMGVKDILSKIKR